jgi:toxin ParE1/3/4
MPRIELAREVAQDFDRIVDHPHRHEIGDTVVRILGIIAAMDVLEIWALIGRPARETKRELVIGQGSRSYVALTATSPKSTPSLSWPPARNAKQASLVETGARREAGSSCQTLL